MLSVEKMRKELEANGHKIVANTMTAEELDELERTEFGKDCSFVSEGPWEETVRSIRERRRREEKKMTSIRVPVWILEGLKRNAERGGVKFSEYAIEALAKAAL